MSQFTQVAPRTRARPRLRDAAGAGDRTDWSDLMPRGNAALGHGLFAVAAALADGIGIVAVALLVGMHHHAVPLAELDLRDTYGQMGLFVAILFVFGNIARHHYDALEYFTFADAMRGAVALWNVAFVCAMAVAFLTKTSSDFSRATALAFYPLGFALVTAARWAIVAGVRQRDRAGRVPARRLFLVGYEAPITAFTERLQARPNGMRIVTAAILRGRDDLADDLALAAASARMLRPDDVFILVPWSDTAAIETCVTAFLRVPASIHLGPERVLDRFADARIARLGSIASLNLSGHALTMLEIAAKRLFDLAIGSLVLLAAAPVMALLALAIKLDSPGPVFFLQRRYGFNQEPFRIVKFRSMRTREDGATIAQVRAGDPRVTRVGRFVRRFNLDELPQIFNVLRGEMSLVGPRPHALAHDQMFEQGIALYARRHNVKPGITGWAQVNGFRGETATPAAIRGRIDHDLWYIDNWSFLLDCRILSLTLFSPKAYRNAR